MNKRCDGCVHWDAAKSDPYNLTLAMGLCNKAVASWDATETEWKEDPYENAGLALLSKYKDQGWSRLLITRADFYCAHHEASDP